MSYNKEKVYPSGYCPSCLKVNDKCTCTEESIERALKESTAISLDEWEKRRKE